MDLKDIAKMGLNEEEARELTEEELEGIAGDRGKGKGAWNDVHAYIEEMNAKYKGASTTLEDLSPDERRHLEWLRSKGYEEWRNRY